MSKLGPETSGSDSDERLKAEKQMDSKTPSRLSALFSRRNLLVGSAALVTASVLFATPVGATAVAAVLAKASVFSLSVLAGSLTAVLGLGLLVRRYKNNTAKVGDSPDNSTPVVSLSDDEQAAEVKGCCAGKKKDVNPSVVKDAPYMDELTSTLAAAQGKDSSSSSDDANLQAQNAVSDAVLGAEAPATVTYLHTSAPVEASSPTKERQHIIFDESSSSSYSSGEEAEYSSGASDFPSPSQRRVR